MDRQDLALSAQAATILRLIAAGHSYDQILMRHPELTYGDIFAAAEEALAKLQTCRDVRRAPDTGRTHSQAGRPDRCDSPEPSVPDRQTSSEEPARLPHRRERARWTAEEDEQLARLFRRGAHLAEIGQALGRHNGAIRSRLAELGLIAHAEDGPDLLLKPADSPRPGADGPPPPRASFGWEGIRQRFEALPNAD